ncbi:MAG: carbohydrate-binding family 9-like protein [Bacteroidales bacterium]|nr:carbohydrate-binding family 9-like protein [Bacteroidales bacterium]
MHTLLIFVYFVSMLSLFQQDKPVYECSKTGEKIEIDGKIDEGAWEKAPVARFVAQDGSGPRLDTRFQWLWDDEYLYGAFHVEDDHLWATMTERDAYLWKENVVEFFINADGCSKSYIEIEINPKNTILDLFVLNKYNARKDIKQLWNWDAKGLKHAVQLKGTLNDASDTDEGWTFEIAIPFDQVYTAPNHPPKEGDRWYVDFCRGEGEEKEAREASSWSPPAFHNPLSYGQMVFRE